MDVPKPQYSYNQIYSDPLRQLSLSEDTIRVVTIHPGKYSEQIKCTLEVVSFPNTEYTALSYTWDFDESVLGEDGPAHVEDPELNGCIQEILKATSEGSRPKHSIVHVNGFAIPIQMNLALAILHLRRPSEALVMWIDYLCIDQENLQERSREVQRMADIYRGAKSVAVWLGLKTIHSDHAVQLMQSVDPDRHLPDMFSPEPVSEEGRRDQSALSHLLGRTWWLRLWVVQEVAFARETRLHIGATSMRWNDLVPFEHVVFGVHADCCIVPSLRERQTEFDTKPFAREWSTILRALHAVNDFRAPGPARLDLESALQRFSDRLCSDRRDIIFCIPAFLPANDKHLVRVDYTETAENVLTDFTLQILKQKDRLLMPIEPGADSHLGDRLPSWAPNWQSAWAPGLQRIFRATGQTSAGIRPCGRRVIKLAGMYLGRVIASHSIKALPVDLRAEVPQLQSLVHLADRQQDTPSGNEGLRSKILWDTLVWENHFRVEPPPAFDNDVLQAWTEYVYNIKDGPASSPGPPGVEPAVERFHKSVMSVLASYGFFVTRTGLFGSGWRSVDASKDDLLFVLRGACMPCILRPTQKPCTSCGGTQTSFELKGPAFVSGLMQGEAMELIDSGMAEWEDICVV